MAFQEFQDMKFSFFMEWNPHSECPWHKIAFFAIHTTEPRSFTSQG